MPADPCHQKVAFPLRRKATLDQQRKAGHTRFLFFYYLFIHDGVSVCCQDDLKFVGSNDTPALASQGPGQVQTTMLGYTKDLYKSSLLTCFACSASQVYRGWQVEAHKGYSKDKWQSGSHFNLVHSLASGFTKSWQGGWQTDTFWVYFYTWSQNSECSTAGFRSRSGTEFWRELGSTF